ncbi:MAG: anthranilate phosphoribosyltransferase [Betaproteobacteria bacterium]|nr:anthranilate phosphoribosyltransferase [Betaproteobacteria bacterium]MDE2622847.1 anthranilate phosphoribosyltransferase [Betaproteobacteria bacterium]
MTPRDALNALLARNDLTREQMLSVMTGIMTGETTPVQTAGIIVALRAKGETVTELAAAAEVMRGLSAGVDATGLEHVVDTCGTGGDGMHTFNISTTAAFVAAAAGAHVAKHGGRSVSSTTGSADVLEALGIPVTQATPEAVARSLRECRLGFMFAPTHHTAMRHSALVRRELGVRTLFNLLGPLTNPAGAPNQLLGVFSPHLTGTLAGVLHRLGSRHALVVHGSDGLDEITLSGPTHVAELKDGTVREYLLDPAEFGIHPVPLNSILVKNAQESRELLEMVLDNRPGPALEIVVLNAGAAIYVAGLAPDLREGIARARQVIAAGQARERLDALVAWSQS